MKLQTRDGGGGMDTPQKVQIGDCVIDFSKRKILRNGIECLTPRRSPYFWPMLTALVSAGIKDRALSYENIAEVLWVEGYDEERKQTIRSVKKRISDIIGKEKIDSPGYNAYKFSVPVVDITHEAREEKEMVVYNHVNGKEVLKGSEDHIDELFDNLKFAVIHGFPEAVIRHYKKRLTTMIADHDSDETRITIHRNMNDIHIVATIIDHFLLIPLNGKILKYSIFCTFTTTDTGKDYILFTDDSSLSDTAHIYPATYKKNGDDLILSQIESKEEWGLIDKVFQAYQNYVDNNSGAVSGTISLILDK